MKGLLFVISVFVLWGANLHAARYITPHLQVVAPTQEQKAHGAKDCVFLFTEFPTNKDFYLCYDRVCKNPGLKKINKLSIDTDGVITVDDTLKVMICSIDKEIFVPGEMVKYCCVDPEGYLIAETSTIPQRLKTNSKDGSFSIEAQLMGITPAYYIIKCKGIQEGEKIEMVSMSGDEVRKNQFVYEKKNKISVSPDIKGKKGGTGCVMITRSSGDHAILELMWGEEIALHLLNQYVDRLK